VSPVSAPGGAEEDGYDVRARHPDREAFYRQYCARSEAVWRAGLGRRDLRYGPHPRQCFDWFPASTAAGRAPVLVFVHGGFWHSHDKSEFSFIAAPFVAAGVSVAAINYPLAPASGLRDIVRSVSAACRWLHDHAAPMGIDRDRIVIAGHSAGAHLAASMVVSPDRPAPGVVAAAICISGIFDLRPVVSSTVNRQIGLSHADARGNSPLLQIGRSACRMMLVVGAQESVAFRTQTAAFAAAWRATNGGDHETVVADAHHYSIVLDFSDPDSVSFGAALRLLRPV
jgi:arylformamidase